MSTLLPRPIILEVGEMEFTDRETAPKPEEEKQWLWDPIRTELQAIATSVLDLSKKLIEDTFGNETTAVGTSEVLKRAKSCLGLHTRKSIGVVVYPELNKACEELQTKQNKILSIKSEEKGPTSGNRTTRVEIEASFLPPELCMTESGTVAIIFQVFLSVFRFFRSTSIPGEERESAQLHQYTSNVIHKLSLGFCLRPDQEGSSRDDLSTSDQERPLVTKASRDETALSFEITQLDLSPADSHVNTPDDSTLKSIETAAGPV
jgi:hypothetical protein